MIPFIFLIYLLLINFIAFLLTYYDKKASKIGLRRVKENTLMLVALLGGSAAMYITMKMIHHKTRVSLFMVGLPFIFVVEMILVIFIARALHIF
ncbi:MAG: DUF1294 domain-containing protein [Ruminococcus sp.]|nr:DUF1294 domain-containing protein [Ruminococcus sp.]